MTSKKNTLEKAAETACEVPNAEAVYVPSEMSGKSQDTVQESREGCFADGTAPDLGAESPEVPNEGSEAGSETCRVAAPPGLNLRSGPGKVYPVVKVLPDKTVVTLTGGSVEIGRETWLRVNDGRSDGWVDGAWLRS